MLELRPQTFHTDFGGLFLFAFDLASLELDAMLEQVGMYGVARIPDGCAVRSLLALKLWGVGRPSRGLALFAGLNAISKRSRRQRGVLTVLARDSDARIFAYGDTTVHRETQRNAVLRFVAYWTRRTGQPPAELVLDSGFTVRANLAELAKMDIDVITLRRRHEAVVKHIRSIPKENWCRISPSSISRKHRTLRIVDEEARLRAYPGCIRQILVKGLGHLKPTVPITNRKNLRD